MIAKTLTSSVQTDTADLIKDLNAARLSANEEKYRAFLIRANSCLRGLDGRMLHSQNELLYNLLKDTADIIGGVFRTASSGLSVKDSVRKQFIAEADSRPFELERRIKLLERLEKNGEIPWEEIAYFKSFENVHLWPHSHVNPLDCPQPCGWMGESLRPEEYAPLLLAELKCLTKEIESGSFFESDLARRLHLINGRTCASLRDANSPVAKLIQSALFAVEYRDAGLLSETIDQYELSDKSKLPGHLQIECHYGIGQISDRLIREMSELTIGLLIDKNLNKPQNGFPNQFSNELLEKWLEPLSSRLFILRANQKMVGFYILDLELPDVTVRSRENHEMQLMQHIYRDGISYMTPSAWLHAVGIVPEGAFSFGRKGIDPYDLVLKYANILARSEGILQILGQVRTGDQANLAIRSHEKKGWKWVGEKYFRDGYEYGVVSLPVLKAVF